MHKLASKIAGWRAELLAAKIEEVSIRELEAHLLDHIDTLINSGVSPEEAFQRAAQHMGDPRMIAREFSLLQRRWVPAFRPARIVLLLLAALVVTLFLLIGAKFSHGKLTLLLAVHVLVTTLAYLTVFATGAIAACALVIGIRRGLREPERQSLGRLIFRLTLTSSIALPIGIMLGMFWAAYNLGRAWAWAPVETGAAFALFSTLLLLLVQLLRVDHQRQCVLATLGAVSLAIGWFGANAVESTAPIAWLCGAFGLAQIVTLRTRPPERC